jgi:hypothetical protein
MPSNTAPLDDDVLEATDDDSDGETLLCTDDEQMFASDEDNSVFHATDSEPEQESANQKREYNSRQYKKAVFLGKTVCKRGYARLLGVGTSSIQKVRVGEAAFTNKIRAPKPKHPTFGFALNGSVQMKWMKVVMFLWYVYHSSAEVMPTHFHMPRGRPDSSVETPFVEPNGDDFALRHVNQFLQTLHTYSNDPDVNNIGPGTFAGARRSLQHSSRTEMFWEYVAFCRAKDEEPASYTTFLKVANKVIALGGRGRYLTGADQPISRSTSG